MNNKKNTKTKVQKFDSEKELKFWEEFQYKKDEEKKILDRLIKIRCEDLQKNVVINIADQLEKKIPLNNQPLFFLKLYIELPKKDCSFSTEFRERIAQKCKRFLKEAKIEENEIDAIGQNICVGKYGAECISKILVEWKEKLIQSEFVDCESELKDCNALSILYMHIVLNCKEYSSMAFYDNLFLLEKCFVETFRSSKKRVNDCIGNCVPKAISKNTFQNAFFDLSFLYHDINSEIEERDKIIKNLTDIKNHLVSECSLKNSEIQSNYQEISLLKNDLESSKVKIEQLEKELVSKSNLLEYEKNKYSEQYNTKARNLLEELEQNIGIELQGIVDVAERLPDREKEKILKQIRKIKEKAGNIGGQV